MTMPFTRLPGPLREALLGAPLAGIVAVAVFPEPRPAEGEVNDPSPRVVLVLADQPVPGDRQAANGFLVAQPIESVQIKSRSAVDIINSQVLTALVVEDHEARPVFSRVHGLDVVEEFPLSTWSVVVLANQDRLAGLASYFLRDDGEIHLAEHVAVHEHRPTLELRQC